MVCWWYMCCSAGGNRVDTLGRGEAGLLCGSSFTKEHPSSEERQESADVEPQVELELEEEEDCKQKRLQLFTFFNNFGPTLFVCLFVSFIVCLFSS